MKKLLETFPWAEFHLNKLFQECMTLSLLYYRQSHQLNGCNHSYFGLRVLLLHLSFNLLLTDITQVEFEMKVF